MDRDQAWLLEEKYCGKESDAFMNDVERLALGEPLAYVIGWQPFLGLKIFLDSHPLIPRPETEWWTERLFAQIGDRPVRFLDLCSGSGAIGCAALASLPNAEVYFGEVDAAHQATIAKNIRENSLDASRAHIRIGNLFEPFGDMRFDVIAANPPYVPIDRTLPKSVALYEPSLALHAGPDGLDIMREIAHELPGRLTEHGIAWIECDRNHAEETRKIFEEQGLAAHVLNDQYGKPRMVVVSLT